MKRKSLYFVGREQVSLQTEELADPAPGEVRVASVCSVVSAGTELLLYKGEAPADLAADATLPALSGTLAYPCKYGYCMVGAVEELGKGVDSSWRGRQVFAFNPHETAFIARVEELLPLPAGCSQPDAAFLPAMETAINLILDGEPRLGERVAILGQGVIGLLTTALLARHPLQTLLTFDGYPPRRALSLQFGAQTSLDPQGPKVEANHVLGSGGADLVYELTGNPATLDLALDLVGDHGRVVVGSWYGARRAAVNLGGRFHRGRIKLISSQVSHIEPSLRGRWDQARRFAAAWHWLAEIQPSRLASRTVPFEQANSAYEMLAKQPDKYLTILFTYN
ncbi:MAG TPA: zinc-binding alcohol dehydrogenase [Anaerolineales bacterium]